jgi:hypothetical protein
MAAPIRETDGVPGPQARLFALVRWTRWTLTLAGGLILLVLWVGPNLPALSARVRPASHIALDIMPVKPGGPAENYAAYLPSTALTVPAHSLVSVTIRNFDLDPAPQLQKSVYARVQGTLGGVAYADGAPFATLDLARIAHTFTVPALGLNVPIPGRSSLGQRYVTVTFRFRTGGAGTYAWRCFAPCGDGPDGQAGPMADEAYMRGTLFVQS